MAKLNPTTMKTQYDGQYDTFCRKNHDYGNSFEESLDQFGIIASLVRMQDKMLRLQSLTDESKTQQVGSESLLDTLEDLSNYAAMTACWLKGVQAEDDVVISELQKHIDVFPNFSQAYKNSLKSQCMKEYNKVEQVHPNKEDEVYDFLEERIDRAVGYITHVRTHGKVPQRLDVCDYAYDIARFAVEHYEDPFVIIQHMNRINSISVLDDDDIMLLHTSITNYIQEIMKKGPTFDKPIKLTDHLKKFVEEVTDDIISVVLMKQRDEEMLVPADLDDDTSRIIKCITDNEFDPNYVVSYMEALMGNAGIPPYLREWIRGIILRGVYYRNKGRSMTKAKDKARGVVMKGSRGNSNVIVMASRGSGKGLMKTKSLLEELGVPKEDIKEIFEGLEDEDDE